jgi:hypothetical protein
MQNYDQSARRLQDFRHEGKHPKITRIGPELRRFDERTRDTPQSTRSQVFQSIDESFRDLSEELDVFSR